MRRALIAFCISAVKKGVALEIQGGSPYPRPGFLLMVRRMGTKFSFGANNFDSRPTKFRVI